MRRMQEEEQKESSSQAEDVINAEAPIDNTEEATHDEAQ